MTNILIVEDDDDKAIQIEKFVSERTARAHVVIARSLQSGLKAALFKEWSLILLDMTMTNFDRSLADDGGRPHHFAGREILRQLKREGVSVPVIIVTQFDRFGEEAEELTLQQLEGELTDKFPNFRGIVRYRSNVNDWQFTLEALMAAELP